MPLVEIEMLISRHTSHGAKSKGDKVSLPYREANSFIARGQAREVVSFPEEIEPLDDAEETD